MVSGSFFAERQEGMCCDQAGRASIAGFLSSALTLSTNSSQRTAGQSLGHYKYPLVFAYNLHQKS